MLKEKIPKLIETYDADIAVLVKNLNTNEIIYKFNEDKIFPSASLIKIPIMVSALGKAESSEIPLLSNIKIKNNDKVNYSIITEQNISECNFQELITWMIISSDNTAANVLIDLLGTTEINNGMKSFGMKNSILERKMMDFNAIKEGRNNKTTLNDMLIIMEGLYNGEIISREVCKKALDIMKNQRDNSMLKRYIMENVPLANKTGDLDNLTLDVGIFYTKKADYFIGVCAQNIISKKEGCKIIGGISKIVYDYFIKEGNY